MLQGDKPIFSSQSQKYGLGSQKKNKGSNKVGNGEAAGLLPSCPPRNARAVIMKAKVKRKRTQKSLITANQTRIGNSTKSAQNALLTIYSRQTMAEKSHGVTMERNNVGFTGKHSVFLSSLAEQLLGRGYLSAKQNEILQRIMPKYGAQLHKMNKEIKEAKSARKEAGLCASLA